MSIYAFGVRHITWWIPSSKIETFFTIFQNPDQNSFKENVKIFILFQCELTELHSSTFALIEGK